MSMLLRVTAAFGLLTILGAGCASHEPRAAFRRGVLIDDRGISIPLPPPSVLAAPEQDVDIEGDAPGQDALEPGARVHVTDLEGGAELTADVDVDSATFALRGLTIDVTANCLELWLESPDGRESERTHVHTVIVVDDDGDESIVTEIGCD